MINHGKIGIYRPK